MKKLTTIQKREKLKDVYAIVPKGEEEVRLITTYQPMSEIQLQCGARKEENSIHGVIDADLLEIVRHRLQCFQAGPFASEYNSKALEHIEIALMYMNRRVEDRIERNVLGTYNK